MVMVFDDAGQQIPDLQGPWVEVRDRVQAAADARTAWDIDAVWPQGGAVRARELGHTVEISVSAGVHAAGMAKGETHGARV